MRIAAAAMLALLLASCAAGRPPWADGRFITEERPAGQGPQDLRNLETRLLAIHNRARADVGVPPLAWDARLAAAASTYGPQLATHGRLVHSPRDSRPGQSENLWMGTSGAYSIEEMAGGWVGERRLFRPGTFPNVSTSGNWSDVAHYTQIIWRTTTHLGCAIHRERGWDYLICRYSPQGNIAGRPVP